MIFNNVRCIRKGIETLGYAALFRPRLASLCSTTRSVLKLARITTGTPGNQLELSLESNANVRALQSSIKQAVGPDSNPLEIPQYIFSLNFVVNGIFTHIYVLLSVFELF